MQKIEKNASQLLIFTNVMLLFMFLFESKIQIPSFLEPLGRLHPLMLHLPIGIFIAALILWLLKKYFDGKNISSFLFLIAAITSAITALLGLILAQENGYDPEQLKFHKWGGIVTSVLSWLTYLAISKNWKIEPYIIIGSTLALVITGHIGGEITHGENYVLETFTEDDKKVFDPNGTVYDEAIFPILESKCLSCHNDKKLKGKLNLSSISAMMKGGKDGPIFIAGDALQSHIIKNAKLPIEDKKHMPPKGKPQLSVLELSILEQWINYGADLGMPFEALDTKDTLRKLISDQYQTSPDEVKTYDFSAASSSDILGVNNPFCTVSELSLGSPALKADFYVAQRFDVNSLKSLEKVKKQLVELSLAKMPISDDDLKLLSSFENLETLNLNFTNIKGTGLKNLSKSIESLSLSGSKLSKGVLGNLNELTNLKTLYLWETGIDEKEIAEFQKSNPEIRVVKGYMPTDKDIIKLNAPIMASKTGIVSKAQLKHSLKDVSIRYAIDGSVPDSAKGELYQNEIPFEGFLNVKAIATKGGWLASDVKTFTFFKSNFKADSAWLISEPDKQYPGKGAKTVIDQMQGDKRNFKDFAWLGYKQNNAEILIKTEGQSSGLTVSFLNSLGSFIMPPTEVQLWAGNSKESLELVGTKYPKKLTKEDKGIDYGGISFPFTKKFIYFKIVAKPISKLPSWHSGAGQKAWLFIDEIYFY